MRFVLRTKSLSGMFVSVRVLRFVSVPRHCTDPVQPDQSVLKLYRLDEIGVPHPVSCPRNSLHCTSSSCPATQSCLREDLCCVGKPERVTAWRFGVIVATSRTFPTTVSVTTGTPATDAVETAEWGCIHCCCCICYCAHSKCRCLPLLDDFQIRFVAADSSSLRWSWPRSVESCD